MNINDKVNTIVSYLAHIRIYHDTNRVRVDVTDVFRFFPNLVPSYGNRGVGNTLIFLKGTIPIIYRQITYYIPIVVWIPENFPLAPPVIVLDPTPDMDIVRGHPQVGDGGICLHQYLTQWVWSCNIAQSIKILCDTFSAYPPLITKHAQQPQQQQQQQSPPFSKTGQPQANQSSPSPVTTRRNETEEALQKCTEKLQVLLSSFYHTTSKEIENYIAHNGSLEERTARISQEVEALNKELSNCEVMIINVTERNDQYDRWLLENKRDDKDVDIDSLSEPREPITRQLLQLVSEDQTIEDTLYYLDKALQKQRISLEEYLKSVRSLSREQFMIRATIKKAQQQLQFNMFYTATVQ
ncbi:hypothetical protein SAMD00019534_007640 [Acytostelium subglobosum LB1]|uniref:hypothetical protein n=1 Tax=Acytostelium subglobosum LB1 TaxID=1410327 RepID=UPI000644AC06|nr:hypothetical protein SAMD00019534_007640 [Acytostelium subglobosum LB1]GAM17589.1 hypothetical protein SAMD00019534_007640 [Acytostelium subglobosum LB1]|eukprot:XP_012759651.1 hypothetical protein SAMD00019534_007640 [Acytostelium subglobosum LB1]